MVVVLKKVVKFTYTKVSLISLTSRYLWSVWALECGRYQSDICTDLLLRQRISRLWDRKKTMNYTTSVVEVQHLLLVPVFGNNRNVKRKFYIIIMIVINSTDLLPFLYRVSSLFVWKGKINLDHDDNSLSKDLNPVTCLKRELWDVHGVPWPEIGSWFVSK